MLRSPRSLVLALAPFVLALALAACGSTDPNCDGTTNCLKNPVCGNGQKEGTEACDDGNQTPGDGCENDCTVTPSATCGNGTKEGTEQCDDGNQTNGDGCENDCTFTPTPGQVCGDGVKQGNEACDDGNQTNGDGCENDCTLPSCGNTIQDANEACDDGNLANGDACEGDCTLPRCGNAIKDANEACDDGNQVAGDGCESDCTVTPVNYQLCGNAKKEGTEQCDDGNTDDTDGCKSDCTFGQPAVQTCPGASLTPPATGTCTVTAGDGNRLFTGTVLTPSAVYTGGQVLVDSTGTITCSGCDCTGAAGAATATQVVCPGAVISPGLINLHDHITYQDPPYVPTTDERYEHRNDWRTGANGHTVIDSTSANTGKPEMIRWAELRQIMAGETSVAGSGGEGGLLRNLDKASISDTGAANQEGLGEYYAKYDTFPLGDSNGTELVGSCAYPSSPSPAPVGVYLPHLGEGIASAARNEILCTDGVGQGGWDVIGPNTAIIHGVGVLAADIGRIAMSHGSLIWSPRSNVSLYGDTAPISEYYRLGVPIALGTDWVISGSMNLLRELKCADGLDQTYFGQPLSDADLWRMVTSNPATIIQMSDKIGALEPGKVADLAIFRPQAAGSVYRAVIDAQPQDVVLTMRGGKAIYGDSNVVSALSAAGVTCEALDVCNGGTPNKSVCDLQNEIGESLSTLTSNNASTYGLFFCGTPTNEPTCTPQRSATWVKAGSNAYSGTEDATDSDGDGIPDTSDDCPTTFNPIRPMDHGTQADADGDGVGDACDVCPLDAATTTCSAINPNDVDGDGVADAVDNCPDFPNADQTDVDNDSIGDVCDVCPSPNPGNTACPVSIYDLKTPNADGVRPFEGVNVTLHNVLVTATSSTGFFLQVAETEQGYVSADYSAIFAYTGSAPTVTAGDRIDIATTSMKNFFGEEELSVQSGNITVESSGNALPVPVVATSAELGDGGARADALEAVLVTVQNAPYVTVTDTNPAVGGGDKSAPYEFVVDGTLRVDDEIFALSPPGQLGEQFVSITGIHDYSHDHFRIEPRTESDFVFGPALLSAFGPQPAYARVGDGQGPTFPQPLTISIARAQVTDTTVTITPSVGDLSVANGGQVVIPAGQLSAEVDVTGLNPDPTVTLTATLSSVTLTADVGVLPAGNTSNLVGLTPDSGSTPPGEARTFTVTLDSPPAADTVVTLAISPASGFGTLPASVTVPRNQLSATFDLTLDPAATGTATVSATLNATTLNASVLAYAGPPKLKINEVDYDQEISNDTAEYVEILNTGTTNIDLTNVALVLINGSSSALKEYKRFDLSTASGGSTLAPGQYLVVGATSVVGTAPAGCSTIDFGSAGNVVQNGSPDGVALFDTVTHTLIDSLAYEGGFTGKINEGTTPTYSFNFLEGTTDTATLADSNTAPGSLSRLPNGTDTDNNATDFAFTSTLTPCAANQ